MAVTKPVSVPKKDIGSVDITGFGGGMYLNGASSAAGNNLVESEDVELTINSLLGPRRSLQRWLPDTVGTVYQIYPVLFDNVVVNFTADNGKIKWCLEGATEWIECGGDNSITTGPGIKPMFLRIQDVLLVLNGGGGDRLMKVSLATKTVIKYAHVDDPTTAPSAVASGITNTGAYKIYYGFTYSSETGETILSPILTYTISKPRDQWKSDGTEFLTITRTGTVPVGAKYWGVYIALASNGGVISPTDMLSLASGLDIAQSSIVDNGTLAIDIGKGTPPQDNSTDGPRCKYGIETNGRPVLYGDVDNPYNIWIGGDGEYGLDFSASNGGYRAEVSKGTNYYPAGVIGFRNGQGIPSLTLLFSNTQGLSKQATLEQQTIEYGNQSFVVWGVTEQNYGAAGVASAHSLLNYKGQLSFASTDGMMSMDTQPSLQNVLATKNIDDDVKDYMKRIKTSALAEIVGTAWNNRQLWLFPAYGFDTPNEIGIRDLNNNGAWMFLKIPAQWIGVVSPPNSPAFVYICQGNQILKLYESFGTVDYKSGAPEPFSTYAKGGMLGINDAHNAYQATVQAVFNVEKIIGTLTVGVNYRNQFGKIKMKKKTFKGPQYVLSASGGWSDPQYSYGQFPMLAGGWDAVAKIDESASLLERVDKRIVVPIGDLVSEAQWWLQTEKGYNDWRLRAVHYEGENLGVKPDLR